MVLKPGVKYEDAQFSDYIYYFDSSEEQAKDLQHYEEVYEQYRNLTQPSTVQPAPLAEREMRVAQARKVQEGLYEYRGYVIEDMKKRAGEPYTYWNIDKLPEGQSVEEGIGFAERVHTTNTLKEAKEWINNRVPDAPLAERESRAATATEPAYMDFSRKQIRDTASFQVGFHKGEEIPLTHVARINIDDFLKLSSKLSVLL